MFCFEFYHPFSVPYAQQLTLGLSVFLSFAVYSLRISSELPVQSEHIPTITIYYIVSIVLTLMVMLWFYLFNAIQASGHIPLFLLKIVLLIRKFGSKKVTKIE
jgi:hypothetical protein